MTATITLRFIQSREINLKNFLRAADFQGGFGQEAQQDSEEGIRWWTS
jgi:hypothetical protein